MVLSGLRLPWFRLFTWLYCVATNFVTSRSLSTSQPHRSTVHGSTASPPISWPLDLSHPLNLIGLLYMALLRCHQFRDLSISLNLSTSQPLNLIGLLYMALLRCHQFQFFFYSPLQVHDDGYEGILGLVTAFSVLAHDTAATWQGSAALPPIHYGLLSGVNKAPLGSSRFSFWSHTLRLDMTLARCQQFSMTGHSELVTVSLRLRLEMTLARCHQSSITGHSELITVFSAVTHAAAATCSFSFPNPIFQVGRWYPWNHHGFPLWLRMLLTAHHDWARMNEVTKGKRKKKRKEILLLRPSVKDGA